MMKVREGVKKREFLTCACDVGSVGYHVSCLLCGGMRALHRLSFFGDISLDADSEYDISRRGKKGLVLVKI